jgi:MOSC domain-containing protein YiiM
MWSGNIVSIHIAPTATGPVKAVGDVQALAGQGLEGDRYCRQEGTFSTKPGPDREVTLIESEALEALARDYGVDLGSGESRRNLTTRGVPLNHLVGREFRIGEVRVRGLRLCEPCAHLEKATGKQVIAGLTHRGGLRAQILTTGSIRVGDSIEEA